MEASVSGKHGSCCREHLKTIEMKRKLHMKYANTSVYRAYPPAGFKGTCFIPSITAGGQLKCSVHANQLNYLLDQRMASEPPRVKTYDPSSIS